MFARANVLFGAGTANIFHPRPRGVAGVLLTGVLAHWPETVTQLRDIGSS